MSETEELSAQTMSTFLGSLDAKADDVGTGLRGAPACGDVMKVQVV